MNKAVLGIIGGVAVIGVVVFLAMGGNKNGQEKAGGQSSGEQEQAMTQDGPKSLKELMAIKKPQKCEYADQTEDGSYTGVVYMQQGKMRGDFTVETGQGTFISHIVAVNDEVYTWEDSTGTAYKMKAQDSLESETDESQQQVDLGKEFNYHCEDWSVDSSKFNLPEGKEFTDLSAMMESAAQMMQVGEDSGAEDIRDNGNSTETQCAACQQLPEDARVQCLAALGCN